jgi:WD40 repeat protein
MVLGLVLASLVGSRLQAQEVPPTDGGGSTLPLPDGAVARLGSPAFRHEHEPLDLDFSPDGRLLATSDWNNLWVWDTATGRLVCRKTLQGSGYSVRFAPDGKSLVTTGTLAVWDVPSFTVSRRFQVGSNARDLSVLLSPDGTTAASFQLYPSNGDTPVIWDARTGARLRDLGRNENAIRSAAFSRDGRILATADRAETLSVWEVHTGKLLVRYPNVPGGGHVLAFTPDGNKIVSAGGRLADETADRSVHLLDRRTGRPASTLGPAERAIECVAMSPDGQYLATGHYRGLHCLWDMNTGRRVREWQGDRRSVRLMAFSPDGKKLASINFGNSVVRLWDDKPAGRRSHWKGMPAVRTRSRSHPTGGLCSL